MFHFRSHRVLFLAAAALLSIPTASHAQWLNTPLHILNTRPAPPPPDSVLVKFRPGKTIPGLQRVAWAGMARVGPAAAVAALDYQREIPKLGIQVYHLGDPSQMQMILAGLRRMPEVLYAEPNSKIDLLIDPNDTYFALMDDSPNHVLFPPDTWPYQWPLQFINAAAAWSVWPNKFYTAATKPANSVKVAVIDTGIDITHPDFKNAGGASVNAANGGQIDLADSQNLVNGGSNPSPSDPSDDFGHGTHVSGIIAAATNNAEGVSAIGYNGQIMSLKVTDPVGDGDDADVITAVIWAVDHGAVVMNMSIAVNGGYSQGLQDAVNYAWQHNVLVVAAAGNDGVDYVRRYPAACDKVLAVAATTFASADTSPPVEQNASYSNSGLYVGIAAPGGDGTLWNNPDFGLIPELYTLVWSTTPTYDTALTAGGVTEYTYGYLNGTSMASPHVAGLATLYAGYKGFTQASAGAPTKIIQAIQKGADNIAGRLDGGWTTAVGHGRINALATMQGVFGVDKDASTPGCITGQVTYFGTPVMNAAITAVRSGSSFKYYASSKEDGTYRLPNLLPGSYTVSVAYIGLLKTRSVTVLAGCDVPATDVDMDSSGILVTVTPHTWSLGLGGSKQFTANVTGTGTTGVTWSVIDGPGTIGADGTYYAPTTPQATNVADIQATSLADPTKFDIAQVTIVATPSSVTFDQNPATGGTNVTGTVTLTSNAPTGGAVVALSSNNTAAATVPANVTVAAGTKTATFPVTTFTVTTSTNVGITASLNSASATGTLTLNPASGLQGVTLNPTMVYGTQVSTGTVTLQANAPVGGTVIGLSSSNTTVAKVPATVTVAAGSNTATFSVTSQNVASDSTATISATLNGSSVGALLTVKVAVPSTLTLNPTEVRGGKPSTGTITLTGPAPTGGLKVNLLSSNTAAATVLATMTIAATKTSGTFPVTTLGVASQQTSTISGTAKGVTVQATLTVDPAVPKSMTFNPTSVVGGNPVTATLTLDGKAPAGGLVVTLSSDKPGVASPPASVTVAAGASTATFTITTTHGATTQTAHISATANGVTISPALSVKP